MSACDVPCPSGSPAIALEVVRLLAAAGLHLQPNSSFDGKRFPLVMPKKRVKGITYGPTGSKLVQDAELVGKAAAAVDNVVCKCERVTEAEVVAACHRSLPIDSTQAIRKRTRAGMGSCQGKGLKARSTTRARARARTHAHTHTHLCCNRCPL